jgi:hypothetical protein
MSYHITNDPGDDHGKPTERRRGSLLRMEVPGSSLKTCQNAPSPAYISLTRIALLLMVGSSKAQRACRN